VREKPFIWTLAWFQGSKDIEGVEISFEVSGVGRRAKTILLQRVFAIEIPDLQSKGCDVSQWDHLKGVDVPADANV